MPSGWYSCNSYAISKGNAPQGFVLFVKFVFSKIKRQILPDSNKIISTSPFYRGCGYVKCAIPFLLEALLLYSN